MSIKRFNYEFGRKRSGRRILVAPLHWGLGHATRCIPIIKKLIDDDFDVIVASDGAALELLQQEFPQLVSIELPSYDIKYSRRGMLFKFRMVMNFPQIKKAIAAERKVVKSLVEDRRIDGIISDNRLGVRHKRVPSVFITHQLNVLSGSTSWFSTKAHRKIIRKFDECWVPDIDGPINLSGKLGHLRKLNFNVRYIGVLSRMQREDLPKKYDILCILSGPEPQRSLLEELVLKEFSGTEQEVLLVRGVVENVPQTRKAANITICNYMTTKDLQDSINQSELVIARSGYTTIMDLASMGKDCFFIPTPGQYEQEYLAKRLHAKGIVPYCKQSEFSKEKVRIVGAYTGFSEVISTELPKNLFSLFEGKREF